MKNNLTFVVFTYNEEKRISGIIENLKGFGEILIIDNFSKDNTIALCEKFGVRVCQFRNQGYVETQEELEFVKSNINTEYMTWSFCDWVWPNALLTKIVEITNENKIDCIDTIQYNYHYGVEYLNFLTFFGGFGKKNWKGFNVVFKKNCIKIDGIIHANLRIDGNLIFKLPREKKYYIHHLSVYNVKKFELGCSNYSDIESVMLYESRVKSSLIKTFIKIIIYFMKYYFIEGGWRSGRAGFIMIMQYMFFYFNTWAKHYELENNISLDSIESNYSNIRKNILKEYKI